MGLMFFGAIWCGGVLCLVVNSQLWVDSLLVPDQAVQQDAWLEDRLRELNETRDGPNPPRALVFQHVPWFLSDPDEPVQYFNLAPDVRKTWLPKLKAAGKKI